MKILGVNIRYDEQETFKLRAEYKGKFPVKKLCKLRYYEVTNEFDMFRKYCFTFSHWDVLCLHVRTIVAYWIYRFRLRVINN